jgi:acetolactate synthase-1/2/3 large subunit
VATLILPSDASWDEGGIVADPLAPPQLAAADPHAIDTAARVLREGRNVLLLLAGRAVLGQAQAAAWRIAQATGASLMADFVNAHVARGRGRLQLERVPYVTDAALAALRPFDHIILVNAKPPVGFFAYPDKPSTHYRADAQLHVLTRPDQDPLQALDRSPKHCARRRRRSPIRARGRGWPAARPAPTSSPAPWLR